MIVRAGAPPSTALRDVEHAYWMRAYLGTGIACFIAIGLATLAPTGDEHRFSATAHIGSTPPVSDSALNFELAARSDNAPASLVASDAAKFAVSQPEPPLFFGHLEFHWDPNTPGSIPGFGPWPPSKASVISEATAK